MKKEIILRFILILTILHQGFGNEVSGQRFLSYGWVGRMHEKVLLWPKVGLVSYSCNNGICRILCTFEGTPLAQPVNLELDGLSLEMFEVNGQVYAILQQFNKRNTSKYKAEGNRIIKRKANNKKCLNERKIILYELVYPFTLKEISEWDFDEIFPFGFVQNGDIFVHGLAAEWNCKKRKYDLYMIDLLKEKIIQCPWKEFNSNDQNFNHVNILYSKALKAPILIRSLFNKQSSVLYSLAFKTDTIENIFVPLNGTDSEDIWNHLIPNLWFYHEDLAEESVIFLYYWKSNNYKQSFFHFIKINKNGQILWNTSLRMPYQLSPIYGSHRINNQMFNMSFVVSKLVPDSSTYISVVEENGKFNVFSRTSLTNKIVESHFETDYGPEYSGFLNVWQFDHLANYCFDLTTGEAKLLDTTSKSLKLHLLKKDQIQIFYNYGDYLYSR